MDYCLDTLMVFDQVVRIYDGSWLTLMLLCRASYIAATNYAKEPHHNHKLMAAKSVAAPIINVPHGQFGTYIDIETTTIGHHIIDDEICVKICTIMYGAIIANDNIKIVDETTTFRRMGLDCVANRLYAHKSRKHLHLWCIPYGARSHVTINTVLVQYKTATLPDCVLSRTHLDRVIYNIICDDANYRPYILIVKTDGMFPCIINIDDNTHIMTAREKAIMDAVMGHPDYSHMFTHEQ
jgi:hypothetical protein